MIIHFKNGEKKYVINEIGRALADKLSQPTCANFQIFRDQNSDVLLIVNVLEITYIE